jgi:hypothetical protein
MSTTKTFPSRFASYGDRLKLDEFYATHPGANSKKKHFTSCNEWASMGFAPYSEVMTFDLDILGFSQNYCVLQVKFSAQQLRGRI